MRISELKGILKNLLELNNYKNPLHDFVEKRVEANLLTGSVNSESQKIKNFIKEKGYWFKEQIIKAGGNLEDFQKARLILNIKKEYIKVVYHGREYSYEKVY